MTFLEAAALVALSAADAQITAENMRYRDGYERNAIAQPFVTHGIPLQVGATLCAVGFDLYLVKRLERSNHRRWAHAVLWTSIGVEAGAVGYSWSHHRGIK